MSKHWLIALILACSATAAAADSLWTANSRSLFVDRRASRVGDLLAVLVVESVTATHQATHQTNKALEAESGGGNGLLSFFPDFGLSAERSTSGSGASTQSTRISDRLSVTVTALDPAGNLIIEGSRLINLGADKLEMRFRGKVRPDDVEADNTVLSSDVADLEVTWSGKGPIAEKQKPGLISRLLHFLW